jgi:large subunit ribosomal protein L6
MSRIGKMPILVPANVKVNINLNNITVEGPKGKLARSINSEIKIEFKDNNILVSRPNDLKKSKALHGLFRNLIFNMVKGVSNGFEKKLNIVGVGYRAALNGKKLNLTLGYSHPVEFDVPEGIKIDVQNQTEIVVSGIDKELVGQTAANIRFLKKPEPYLGKGIKYFDEVIRRKAGKTASSGK